MKILLPAIFVIVGVLLLVACTGSSTDSGVSPSGHSPDGKTGHRKAPVKLDPSQPKVKETPPMKPADPEHTVPQDVIDKVYQKVSEEAGIEQSGITLVKAEAVTWRDGSLGCPQSNMAYTQALIDGYWVLLRVGREEFDYRVTRKGHMMRCKGSTRQAPIRYDDS